MSEEWFETLEGMALMVQSVLLFGTKGTGADRRNMVLATTAPDGWPEARTVVARRARWPEGAVEVWTDLDSAKIASLRADPRAALCAWDPEKRLQVRFACRVDILTGEDVTETWDRLDTASRENYGKAPAPGQEISEPLNYALTPDAGHMAILLARVERIDAVYLGAEGHRRAGFTRTESGWDRRWLSP